MLGPRNHVVVPFETLFLAALLQNQRRAIRGDADERHFLDVGAVGVAGFQTELPEFVDEVLDGERLALRAGAPALELV